MAPGSCAFCGYHSRPIKAVSRASLLAEYQRMFKVTFPESVLVANFAFDRITMYECRRCGTRSYDPMVEGDTSYYAHLSATLPWYYQKGRWEFRLALDTLKKEGARAFLDIGCGEGHFLELAASEGLAGVGFEINADALVKAKLRGVDVRAELDGDHVRYDAIVMFQFIEHLRDPLSYLKSLLPRLRKNGVLLVSTPIRPSCAAANSNVFLWPPHHQWLPTTVAYTHLAARLGLSCERVICDPPDIHQVEYAIKKWCGSLPLAERLWRIGGLERRLARLFLRAATALRWKWTVAGHTGLAFLRNVRGS
jgi:SAM-dependent methyltransferase